MVSTGERDAYARLDRSVGVPCGRNRSALEGILRHDSPQVLRKSIREQQRPGVTILPAHDGQHAQTMNELSADVQTIYKTLRTVRACNPTGVTEKQVPSH